MPNFISRLFRPLSSSTRLGITSEGANGVAPTLPEGAEKATIAAGCFWGVEHLYRKHFGGKGLIDARVGYTGGDTSHPSYRQVCSESTGRESLSLLFAPSLRIKEETKENQKTNPKLQTQTQKRCRSSSTPRRRHTGSCSSSSTGCTTRRRRTGRGPTSGRSTGARCTSTARSRRGWRARSRPRPTPSGTGAASRPRSCPPGPGGTPRTTTSCTWIRTPPATSALVTF